MRKVILLFVLTCCLIFAGQAMAVSLSLSPATQTIGIGDTATVDLSITLGANETLAGFDFELIFDSTILAFDDLNFAMDVMDYFPGYTYPAANADMVTFNGFFLGLPGAELTNGTFDVASLSFTGLSGGSSLLNMVPYDPTLFYPNGNSVSLWESISTFHPFIAAYIE